MNVAAKRTKEVKGKFLAIGKGFIPFSDAAAENPRASNVGWQKVSVPTKLPLRSLLSESSGSESGEESFVSSSKFRLSIEMHMEATLLKF